MSTLFFIAIIPPQEIASMVTALKEEMAGKFNSKRALKSPPHITLIPPFYLKEEQKDGFNQFLKKLASQGHQVRIELKDFVCFENRRRKNPVIFIHPENSPELKALQEYLTHALSEKYSCIKKEKRSFSPHMTIAFKDLTVENFDKAWPEFKERRFKADFIAKEVFLLAYKENKWNISNSFSLAP